MSWVHCLFLCAFMAPNVDMGVLVFEDRVKGISKQYSRSTDGDSVHKVTFPIRALRLNPCLGCSSSLNCMERGKLLDVKLQCQQQISQEMQQKQCLCNIQSKSGKQSDKLRCLNRITRVMQRNFLGSLLLPRNEDALSKLNLSTGSRTF